MKITRHESYTLVNHQMLGFETEHEQRVAKWAMAKIQEYYDDDPEIGGKHLKPILTAYAQGDFARFWKEAETTLAHYCAANVFIDELNEMAANRRTCNRAYKIQ